MHSWQLVEYVQGSLKTRMYLCFKNSNIEILLVRTVWHFVQGDLKANKSTKMKNVLRRLRIYRIYFLAVGI